MGKLSDGFLKNEDHATIGRVAAFIDRTRSAANRQPTGGIGYFEVIEDRDAAFLLFDTAMEWLSARGMEAMDGPINFGENDNNWGLLVDGYMQQGYGMPYHKKYYRAFLKNTALKTISNNTHITGMSGGPIIILSSFLRG